MPRRRQTSPGGHAVDRLQLEYLPQRRRQARHRLPKRRPEAAARHFADGVVRNRRAHPRQPGDRRPRRALVVVGQRHIAGLAPEGILDLVRQDAQQPGLAGWNCPGRSAARPAPPAARPAPRPRQAPRRAHAAGRSAASRPHTRASSPARRTFATAPPVRTGSCCSNLRIAVSRSIRSSRMRLRCIAGGSLPRAGYPGHGGNISNSSRDVAVILRWHNPFSARARSRRRRWNTGSWSSRTSAISPSWCACTSATSATRSTWRRTATKGSPRRGPASYDLIVLDVMLPRRDGLDVVRQLRMEQNPVPMLMLTAQVDRARPRARPRARRRRLPDQAVLDPRAAGARQGAAAPRRAAAAAGRARMPNASPSATRW